MQITVKVMRILVLSTAEFIAVAGRLAYRSGTRYLGFDRGMSKISALRFKCTTLNKEPQVILLFLGEKICPRTPTISTVHCRWTIQDGRTEDAVLVYTIPFRG